MGWTESLLGPAMPWREAGLAFVAALVVAGAARALGRPALAGVAAGVGVLAGWWFAFGLLTATPRQLPERLPLLMLILVLATPLMTMPARRWRWLALPLVAFGALGTGWWMAGAPLRVADLARGWPVLAGVAAGTMLLALRGAPRWAGPVAAAALLAGLHAAPLAGPYRLLGAVLVAASLGAALMPRPKGAAVHPALAALPLAGAMAALAAIPLVARGAPADLAVAAAPLAALLLGAPVAERLAPRRRAAWGAATGAALAGALAAGAAFLLR